MEIIVCPNCNEYIIISELNCGIFRHAVYSNGEQVDPHMSKEDCEKLLKTPNVLGCCKPFRVKVINGEWRVEICGYI
jgi:hypothetical protein